MSTITEDKPATAHRPAPGDRARRLGKVVATEDFWVNATAPVALVAIMVVFSFLSPAFLTVGNLSGMLSDATIPVTLALAATFAVTLAGIDLSLAATVALGSVTAGVAYDAGWSIWACFAVAMATGLAIGLLNGFFVGWVKIPDFIVTLGSLSLVMGLSLIVSDGQPVQMFSTVLTTIGGDSIGPLRYNIAIALIVAVLLHILLFHTSFGVHLLATGDNTASAKAMGLKVARIKLAGYAIGGALAGLASIQLISFISSSQPTTNTDYLLKAIAAVVLGGVNLFGGRATIVGPVLGAILLTVLQQGLTLIGVEAYYEPLVIGIVVLAAATLMRGRNS
ncbi:ABC transporter permease [Spongisporangium articulatum]|uniref:Autoinducer 2 import system permease protein LsrD n=1 Tax=Spongisporangium articulatum TaxID=3362603 RepID=A0ABW8ARP7_9ACTN